MRGARWLSVAGLVGGSGRGRFAENLLAMVQISLLTRGLHQHLLTINTLAAGVLTTTTPWISFPTFESLPPVQPHSNPCPRCRRRRLSRGVCGAWPSDSPRSLSHPPYRRPWCTPSQAFNRSLVADDRYSEQSVGDVSIQKSSFMCFACYRPSPDGPDGDDGSDPATVTCPFRPQRTIRGRMRFSDGKRNLDNSGRRGISLHPEGRTPAACIPRILSTLRQSTLLSEPPVWSGGSNVQR